MRIPPATLLLCGALLALAPAAPARAQGEEAAKASAKWRMAAHAAARQALEELEQSRRLDERERAQLTDALAEAMRANVAAHAGRAESLALCGQWLRRQRRDAAEVRFQQTVEAFSRQSTLPVQAADVREALGADWPARQAQAADDFVAAALKPLFDDARTRTVALARQEADQNVRLPSQEELDARLAELRKGRDPLAAPSEEDWRALSGWLERFAGANGPAAFEELRAHLGETAGKLLDEIVRQHRRQRAAAEKAASGALPPGAVRAARIEAALGQAVEQDIEAARKEKVEAGPAGAKPNLYGMLGLIRDHNRAAATKLETEHLARFAESSPLLDVDPAELERAIRQEPARHAAAAASEQWFAEQLMAGRRAPLAAAYAAQATPPEDAAFFAALLEKDAPAAALAARVRKELQARLPPVRTALSAQEFDRHFQPLREDRPLADPALATLEERRGEPAGALPEALALLRAGGYAGLADPVPSPLLEETARSALELANRRLHDGYEALRGQLEQVRKIEEQRREALKRDVGAKRPFREILKEWTAALDSACAESAQKAKSVYAAPVARARAELDKSVRQLYDSLEQQQATAATAAAAATAAVAKSGGEPHPGQSPEIRQEPARTEEMQKQEQEKVKPPEPPPQEPKKAEQPEPKQNPDEGTEQEQIAQALSQHRTEIRNTPDGVLLLSAADGQSEAAFVTPGGGAKTLGRFAAGDIPASAETIFNGLKPELDPMLTALAGRWRRENGGMHLFGKPKPPELRLFVVVRSDEVRHRMSLLLREKVEDAIAEWSAGHGGDLPAVQLNWKVGLTFEPAGAETR